MSERYRVVSRFMDTVTGRYVDPEVGEGTQYFVSASKQQVEKLLAAGCLVFCDEQPPEEVKPSDEQPPEESSLADFRVTELKDYAKSFGIEGFAQMNKEQLIAALEPVKEELLNRTE